MSASPTITERIASLLDAARRLLTGEPARLIGYGAAVVIVLVVAVANSLGFTQFGSNLSLESAVGLTTTALAVLVGLIETIRHYVYSPNTVQVIAAQSAATGVPVVPPPPASDLDTDVVEGNG